MKNLKKTALIVTCLSVPLLILTWSTGLAKTTRGYDVVSWEIPFNGTPYMETPAWTVVPVWLVGPLSILLALILWVLIALKSRRLGRLSN
jgi:hypothetical protein